MGSFHVFAYYVVVCDVHISFVGRVSGSKDSLLFFCFKRRILSYLMLRTFSKDILFVGNSGNDVIGSLPEFNSDYIFSYILNSYGSIAGIVVVAVLAALVMFIFGASIKQKNELGMVMGFGCGMIILLNILLNLLGALGIIPPASSFLPFLSIGRSNILLCYALVGIIMSIYRYKDVYPKKIRASQVSFQKTIYNVKMD